VPAAAASRDLADAEGFGPARELAAWKHRVIQAWPQVRVEHVESEAAGQAPSSSLGSALTVRVSVALGELTTDDVAVEVVYGRPDDADEIVSPAYATLTPEPSGAANGVVRYSARCRSTSPDRSATPLGCCRTTRCSTAAPSSAWSPTRRPRPG